MGCNQSAGCDPKCSSMKDDMDYYNQCTCRDSDFPNSWVKCTDDGKAWSSSTPGNYNGEAVEEEASSEEEETSSKYDKGTEEPTFEDTFEQTFDDTAEYTYDDYDGGDDDMDYTAAKCFDACIEGAAKECEGVYLGQPEQPSDECMGALMPCMGPCMGGGRSLKVEANTQWAFGIGAFLIVSLVVVAFFRVCSGSDFKEPLLNPTASSNLI